MGWDTTRPVHRNAAVLVALCASCGPVYELKLPSQGGAPWVEGKKDAEQTAFEKRIDRMRDRLAGYEKACPGN